MAASDAYAGSGGWSGGSPLTAGGVLSNYYQKTKVVDPTSGNLTTAQPTQASTQPSSLSRVAATTPATQATPAATPTVAAPTIAVVPTVSRLATTPSVTGGVIKTAATDTTNALGSGVQASIQTPGSYLTAPAAQQLTGTGVLVPTYGGPKNAWSKGGDGLSYYSTYNPKTNQYMADNYIIMIQLAKTAEERAKYQAQQQAANEAAANLNAQMAPQLKAQADALAQYKINLQNAAIADQAAKDKAAADAAQAAAQDAADKAGAFSLAGGLQAPNTQAADQASRNDLAKVISQYSSGLGGVDAAAYNYAGQGAQATQGAVNAVTHQTAYANAFNDNYSKFANALTAQQSADVNAAGQRLSYDIQGVNQAVTQLSQQASQLSTQQQTSFNSQLIPLKQKLAEYELAVKQYGVNAKQTMAIAQTILSGAGSLAAIATKLA